MRAHATNVSDFNLAFARLLAGDDSERIELVLAQMVEHQQIVANIRKQSDDWRVRAYELKSTVATLRQTNRALAQALDGIESTVVLLSDGSYKTLFSLLETGGDHQLCRGCKRPECLGCVSNGELKAEHAAEEHNA